MNKKITKHQASYQNYPKGIQYCDRCSMFRNPHDCILVIGAVKPQGWCRYFDPEKEAA